MVLAGAPEQQPEDEDPARSARIRRATVDTLRAFDAAGTDVVVLESAPTPSVDGFNPLDCLARSRWVEACRFVARPSPDWVEGLTRDQADALDHVDTIDLDRLICPFLPICDPILGGTVVFYNGEHLAEGFTRSLAPQLAQALAERDLLD
ncbi:MAG: SGNH hydrolase domain-containing protein [Acidimicrobiales bacterium]